MPLILKINIVITTQRACPILEYYIGDDLSIYQGIIEPVDGPTPWVSPLVVTPKPKNPDEIRL